ERFPFAPGPSPAAARRPHAARSRRLTRTGGLTGKPRPRLAPPRHYAGLDMTASGNLVRGGLVLLLLAIVPRASAVDCFPGCLVQKGACIKATRTTVVACK